MQYYTLKIISLKFEPSDTVTISFKQPGLKKLKYLAGQYLSLIFKINGRRYVRPYSFSSAPGVEDTLNITIKRVSGGIVSNHIIDTLKVGDIVEVMSPLGDFILSDAACGVDKHIYLWGAGSGVTPLISIAKYALHFDKVGAVTLHYGSRNYESIILKDEIESLEQKFNSRFFVKHFLTYPLVDDLNPNVVQGRIDTKTAKEIFLAKPNLSDTIHYICGPNGLKESVKEVLKGLGISADQIFSEDFEITRNPQDFKDITTQHISIEKNGDNVKLEVVAGKSILEAGLDAMIDLPYVCQTGHCLVCKARLINGKVKTIGIEKMPEGLLENEILLCCGFPLTNDIELAIE